MRILTEHQEKLLNDIRILLSDLRTNLVSYNASREDQDVLAQALRQLDEFFLLVVVGEFNSGKSAFINALLGQRVLKEGVTPTTTQINVLRYGETLDRSVEHEHLHVLSAPVDLLREMSIVDTPGTNAIIREHEEITSQFVPRSDLVLFVTSADRPFTESERAFLEQIRAWGKKVIIVLNKIDLFQSEAELGEVEAFIKANAQTFFGVAPDILPVSARLALRSKLGEPQHWQPSRFEALEAYIQDKLDEKGRLRLKFLNPLGIGAHLVNKHLTVVESRLDLLKADFSMLENVEGQLAVYQEDMRRDFNFRMSDAEKVLYEMDQRGQEYFEETIRLARLFDLLNKNRIQEEFEKRFVADVPQRLEAKVNELIDWLVENDLRQWPVMEHVTVVATSTGTNHRGRWGGSFHYAASG
jgi:small GTP-binding protein